MTEAILDAATSATSLSAGQVPSPVRVRGFHSQCSARAASGLRGDQDLPCSRPPGLGAITAQPLISTSMAELHHIAVGQIWLEAAAREGRSGTELTIPGSPNFRRRGNRWQRSRSCALLAACRTPCIRHAAQRSPIPSFAYAEPRPDPLCFLVAQQCRTAGALSAALPDHPRSELFAHVLTQLVCVHVLGSLLGHATHSPLRSAT